MTRLLIADDHAIVRTGLRALLESEADFELVGEATGGYEAIEMVSTANPDILVLDLSMPDLDGISVTRLLKPKYPNLKILILTIHDDAAMAREAIRSGASGYVMKQAAEAELIFAIQTVLRGDIYLDPTMLRTLLDEQAKLANPAPAASEALTPREVEVLKLIVQGYTNRQIADELKISIRTVDGHRANLTGKLELHSRVDLVRYAREHGLLE